ncbi:GNAT family N-acetyltransferase [Lutibacter flavus]|uniref:Protein N-acetyltransferase, RimJ/RimL family n=1 Tax=Lutibacter flavus TaxID=691689 RepID=A0A238VKL6_9FLAO|nr:GNAT family N-acetyltransferase [Lutibacter flavus]SNR34922.1 Protein N-acetyltransferase, RimJ/RimL family [Lutibacter flavus]
MITIIETERLILREFNINDYKDVYEFGSNIEVQKYTGNQIIESLNSAKELIENVFYSDYKKYGYGRWAVIYKPENKIIGFAGLKYLPEFKETDIGFRILPEYWRKGLTTEASREIIKYGFEKFGLSKIIGITFPENIGSYKVLQKIGMKFYKIDEYNGDGKEYNWYKLEKETYIKQQNDKN